MILIIGVKLLRKCGCIKDTQEERVKILKM